jgi:O-antigen ligase
MHPSSLFSANRAAIGALVAAVIVSLFFRGTGDAFAWLTLSVALLLTAASLIGWRGFGGAYVSSRGPVVLCVGALGVLAFGYQLSLSKDSSFAPTWVLAAMPIAALATLALDDLDRRRLAEGVFGVVGLLAAFSVVRFLAYGERAHLPLVDPNNFATLMYLIWIPFVHERLVDRFRGARPPARCVLLEVALAFLLLTALFATQSRAGTAVVAAALLVWVAIAALRRRSLLGVGLHLGVALAAFLVFWVVSPAELVATRVASLGTGAAARADLVGSALRIFADYPVAGIGAFCFSLVYGAYRAPTEQETAGLFVHNDYVQLLAEGGLLLAALPVVLGFAVARAAWRGLAADVDGESFARSGLALALGAACAHALVNFVFYSLTLALVMGVLAAMLFAPVRDRVVSPPISSPAHRWAFVAGVAFAWVAFAHLALDLVTAGVFQGQPGAPFAATIRQDPERQLRYARLAQTLNARRGIPVLGEAMILARRLDDAPASKVARERTLLTFRRAIRIDPWNPLAYVAMADFVRRHGEGLALEDQEAIEASLLTALALDPTYVPAIDRLIEFHVERRRLGDAYALLKNVIFPWLELLKRRDEAAAERYMTQMQTLAERAGDQEFLVALEAKRTVLASVRPVEHKHLFGTPQPGASGA